MEINDILELINKKITLDTKIKISELSNDAGIFKDYTIEHFLVDYKITLLFVYDKINISTVQNLKELYNYKIILERQVVESYINDIYEEKLSEIELKENLIEKIDVILNKYHLFDLNISIAESMKRNILLERYKYVDTEEMKNFVKICKESINK